MRPQPQTDAAKAAQGPVAAPSADPPPGVETEGVPPSGGPPGPGPAAPHASNTEHLAAELAWLDLLIERRVAILRLEHQAWAGLAADPKLYISHAAADRLLGHNGRSMAAPPELTELDQGLADRRAEIDARAQASLEGGTFLALPALARTFGLSFFEAQAVVICLAPELRRKYDRLYAYLQDDITRKRPSVDLVLELLCQTEAERWAARGLLSGGSRLFRAGLLRAAPDPASPSGSSGLAQFLALEPRILHYLLGDNTLDERLSGLAELLLPSLDAEPLFVDPALKQELLNLARHYLDGPVGGRKLALHLHGPEGVGKRALALAICAELSCPLLCLDLDRLLSQPAGLELPLQLAYREGLLLQAALYLDGVDRLLAEDGRAGAGLKILGHLAAEYGWLTILAGEGHWPARGAIPDVAFHSLELPPPDVPLREAAWRGALAALPEAQSDWARPLARQYRLTPGQIRDAAALAQNWRAMRGPDAELALADLAAACRTQSNHKLAELALKIEPRYGWDDIILPEDKLAQLREMCDQVVHRYRVLDEWGFGRKLSGGKGLSALFSGPPGTGKTMAAEVMAYELGLDLYKIDLAGVVSKYIGETEKNLDRIFAEAETGNAILFFDEADALFGKRTEVSDAHDRYANVETSYLLQRMESYQGVVILASNLRENMDAAFTRRLRFTVEFPFPDAASRELIWRTHFPRQSPVAEGIDYEFLARQFQIAGGNIRNIVLNAAFLAAADGGSIQMSHLLHGARREYEKMGKLWNEPSVIHSSG